MARDQASVSGVHFLVQINKLVPCAFAVEGRFHKGIAGTGLLQK